MKVLSDTLIPDRRPSPYSTFSLVELIAAGWPFYIKGRALDNFIGASLPRGGLSLNEYQLLATGKGNGGTPL